jgi:hypothetical protein
MPSLLRRQAVFTAGMLLFAVLEAIFAYCWVGVAGVEGVLYSVLLCLVPGWLTIYAGDLMRHGDLAAYTVLVGTGLRMLFVLLGLFAVGVLRNDLGFREFTVWLIAGYLVALALETWMVLPSSSSDAAV